LKAGKPPILEPGLEGLIQAGLSCNALKFTDDAEQAVSAAELIWVTFDTPVDEDDVADVGYVEARVASLFPYLRSGAIVLISSQVPVGTTRRLEAAFRRDWPQRDAHFAYSPENLRLGKALDAFRNPGRIVVGAGSNAVRERLRPVLALFCDRVIWMSVESAEMTKHALNAFLANSVAFMNEIAGVCEEVGADAKQVEQGLKSEERIGPRAYLAPGGAFAGGTLARDVAFLTQTAHLTHLPVPLLGAIRQSNDLHKNWPRRALLSALGSLPGKPVAVLGLTYKPGTNTLRRSAAIELCRWLCEQRVSVIAYDPAVAELPAELQTTITLADSALDAASGSDAVVVSTEWPVFREITAHDLTDRMKNPVVLDANRFLAKSLGTAPSVHYVAVGMPKETA